MKSRWRSSATCKPVSAQRDAKKTLVIADREEAIKTACMMAKEKDIVLVAGKGHETYQEIKGVKYPFDDREVVERMLKLFAN
jgi:UDP-N-acetylmuramoyl-L-alanyl-D-glutamate--2,6-diaminopimelate ligase